MRVKTDAEQGTAQRTACQAAANCKHKQAFLRRQGVLMLQVRTGSWSCCSTYSAVS